MDIGGEVGFQANPLPTNQVGTTCTGQYRGYAGFQKFLKCHVLRMDGVQGAQVRRNWVGHLIAIHVIPTNPIQENPDMSVGIDQPRHNDFSLCIEDFCIFWDRLLWSNPHDLSSIDQHRPFLYCAVGHRPNYPIGYCNDFLFSLFKFRTKFLLPMKPLETGSKSLVCFSHIRVDGKSFYLEPLHQHVCLVNHSFREPAMKNQFMQDRQILSD